MLYDIYQGYHSIRYVVLQTVSPRQSDTVRALSKRLPAGRSLHTAPRRVHLIRREHMVPEKTRLVLVFIAALLAVLSFVAYIITGDPRTLLGTSVLAYPLFKVVDYYFSRPEK